MPLGLAGFSLDVETIGGDFVGPGFAEVPVGRSFSYGLADVVMTQALGTSGASVLGQIKLGPKASSDGIVTFGNLAIDFSGESASGLCFASGLVFGACIFNGGSGSGVDAGVSASVVPVPQALALALGALAMLLGFGARRRT